MNDTLLQEGRHTVEVNGIQISYEVRGQGPLLVWHPGGPGMVIQGYPGYEILSDIFTVVYLDPRGVGQSQKLVEIPADLLVDDIQKVEIQGSEAYALERYSDDLAALQALWGLEKINLAGHSHGGFVAYEYATRYPDNVAKVVIVGSAGYMDPTDARVEARREPKTKSDAYQRYLELYQQKVAEGLTPIDWYKYGLMLQLTVDVHDFEKHEQRLRDAILHTDEKGLSYVPAYHFEKYDVYRYDMRPRYRDIKAKVLLLQGRQELLFLPEQVEEAVREIPNAQIVWLEECAHMPMTEQPEAFLQALQQFIG